MSKIGFREWLGRLEQDVIQGEYGYEPGEFAVFPEHWRSMWKEGLSPAAAFRRALDRFAEVRAEEDAARKTNWERIQREESP